MFCPKCGCEYREGFTTCADCGVSLAEGSPAPRQAEYVDLVTVFEAAGQDTLIMAKSLLDAEGIEYLAQGDAFAALAFNLIGHPVLIQVRPADAERAREILAPLEEGPAEGEDS